MDRNEIVAFIGVGVLWCFYITKTKPILKSHGNEKRPVELVAELTDSPLPALNSDDQEDDTALSGGQREYDVIIVGAGLSGLKAAHTLRNKYGIHPNRLLILEAQDYVGGRIKQSVDFIPGVKIDLGAEFIHGDNSMLNEFAEETKQPLQNLFCWAHGDGGPSEEPVDDDGVLGYGLYFFAGDDGRRSRMIRFDEESQDFMELNKILKDLSNYDIDTIDESKSVLDYLKEFNISDEMIELARAGYGNSLASNLEELSLKQSVHWAREEHLNTKVRYRDYRFKKSYSCLVDHLKEGLNIVVNRPIVLVDYSETFMGGRVALQTNNGDIYRAKRAIVTCSPVVLKNRKLIDFLPPLPADKQDAMQSVAMYTATKIILTFSERIWPAGLQGILMAGMLVPEVWFKADHPRNYSDNDHIPISNDICFDSNTVFIAVGYLSAQFAEEAAGYSRKMLIQKFLAQLDLVFSHMKPEHHSADLNFSSRKITPLVPSSRFLRGLVYDWAENHPYVGGAYSSPKAGKSIDYPDILARPINNRLFFAGEATNTDAGACTHSALETGLRVADEVAVSFMSSHQNLTHS